MSMRILVAAAALAVGFTLGAAIAVAAVSDSGVAILPLPALLRNTGLYLEGSMGVEHPDTVGFSPQYPLWSDGTSKRRWIQLPSDTAIDASHPDAFEFPVGTRLWKEFSYERRVETRMIERLANGSWRYATYIWNADGTDAVLAPPEGIRSLAAPGAPGGRYTIPSQADCVACHEGTPVPVLGFTALQLSSDRDPLAPHAESGRDHANLRELVTRSLIRNLPRHLVDTPPRIAAPTPVARAALGYLHANCGHCHNESGAVAGIDLVLAQRAGEPERSAERVLQSLIGHASRFRSQGSDSVQRLVPGSAGTSVVAARMQSNNPFSRMPPLGVQVIDSVGLALVERWIQHDLNPSQETPR